MKCKETHKNLIFFMEDELNVSEKLNIQGHIEECNACKLKLDSLKSFYQVMEKEKEVEFNPFLLTRIQESIKQEGSFNLEKRRKVSLVPLLSSFVLVIVMAGGLWFGASVANIQNENTYADVEMTNFLNDFQQEFVESTLINE